MADSALLLTAAFVAGALNAVAGGGSFLTLPALVFTGVPPVMASALAARGHCDPRAGDGGAVFLTAIA